MKNIISTGILLISLIFLVSCSDLVKKTIQDNPDIVFDVIKDNPSGFMDAVNMAAQKARMESMKKAEEDEQKARDKEFKNPKKPELAGRAIFGESSAPVTIVEYSDFQCPFCKKGADTVTRVMEEYKGKVKLVFKHLPLENKHPNARMASEYFEAIAMQDAGKAYKFKKLVFENQEETYRDAKKLYQNLAKKVGANMRKLAKDMKGKSSKIKSIIDGDIKEASQFGFTGTPGYLINGVSLKGAYPIEEFKKVIDRHLGS